MPKPLTEDIITGDVLHEWTIQEYDQHERGTWWYILMLSVGLVLVAYGLFTQNFLFSLIIILAAIILFLQSHQSPLQVPFRIAELGLMVGNRFYPYTELERFYIIYNPSEVKTLFIETKSVLRPTLRVPLLDQDPVTVRQTLLEFLEEDMEKEQEPLADRAARMWKIH